MIIAPRSEIIILDSNIPVVEANIPVYDSTATYNTNDKVQINGTTNRIYEAIQSVPAGVNPIDDVDMTKGYGTYWYDRGSTNYYRAFDELESSQCTNTQEIYYKFAVSDVDVLMIDNITNAKSIRLVVTNNATGAVVLDRTDNITTRYVYDWFDWTYAPVEYTRSYYATLPLIYDATFELYISNDEAVDVSVGHIAYGRGKKYGLSLINPSPVSTMRGVTSKQRDNFGNIITRRKARYKRMTISCSIDSSAVDLIEYRLNDLADTPAIFVGDERDGGYKALLIYGELKDHDMPISIKKTQYQLEVEGYI